MNCIIIEDQLPAQRLLKKYIADTSSLNLVATFTDSLEAIETINSKQIDLIFLDIHLPKISGMDFLKSLSNPPSIILTTAFQDYALESYEYNVVDYLLKPFSFQRFIKAISKVNNASVNKSADELYIKSGHEHIRIIPEEIIYIMADSDYTEIHFNNKKIVSAEPLRHWENQLSNSMFYRIHKSFIINTNKIIKISGNEVFLQNDIIVPIGRTFKNEFIKKFAS
ncbi:LytR/AlgR family response regulator transcription factor [Winogradskyella vincentii]|uniref:Response regulator transcription factor n=1 Tax=Winogradskyella vincentii TaxID=2877122 RepID=A0ABS7Y0U2_9FLAO|nr:response regulator transcription factor [Winogradskyella vincentii]MCA0153216.1 response regulator transcription factor [Winogradskyella vincentii]